MFTEIATVVTAITNMRNWRTSLLYILLFLGACVSGGRMQGEVCLGVGVPVCVDLHSFRNKLPKTGGWSWVCHHITPCLLPRSRICH